MIIVREADARGRTRTPWLDSRHTFSFGEYYDEKYMGFRALRVINEDRVIPGAGFGTHAHRDMEIVTYVLAGALEHKDSLGTGSVIRPGELQRMSAGTGITHSEFNNSSAEPVHFLQIWIIPARRGLEPSYEQKSFPADERRGRFHLIGAPDGAGGALTIHQDVSLHVAHLDAGESTRVGLAPGRYGWLQMTRGSASVNGLRLKEGDGAALSGEPRLEIESDRGAEMLLFDLA